MAQPRARARNVDPLLFRWRRALVNDPQLTAADRHVALTLSTHMNVDGAGAYPSTRTLAAECARKAHTVIAAIQKLEQFGYLTVQRAAKLNVKGWSSEANHYSAQMPLGTTARRKKADAPSGNWADAPSVTQQMPLGATELIKSSGNGAAPVGAPFRQSICCDAPIAEDGNDLFCTKCDAPIGVPA